MPEKKPDGVWPIIVRNWLVVALTFIGLYATLPFVAPTLMKLGLTGPANVLYTMYSPMCHQFAFRSVFLYGEQTFYPRESVGADLRPYEDYAAEYGLVVEPDDTLTPRLMFSARDFRGNEQMGYKTTLCARDVSIWMAMFIGGLIYSIPYVRRRLRPIPWWLYILAGLGPIGLDGFSQLLSYPPLAFWPVRETAPFFRVATGAMFGLMNAWLLFPILERSFWEARLDLEGFGRRSTEEKA
jgi:uncharacterized membrane protein